MFNSTPGVRCLLAVAIASLLWSSAWGDEVFYDDFHDGDPQDSQPVLWTPQAGQIDATSGDLVVRTSGMNFPRAEANRLADGTVLRNLTNTSMRTQARLLEPGSLLIWNRLAADRYWATLLDNGLAGVGIGGSAGVQGTVQTDFNPLEEDVVMQFDAIGEDVSLRIWRPGDPMPADPLLSFTSDRSPNGNVAVGLNKNEDSSTASGVYRYVHVATTPIPEPSTATLSILGCIGYLLTRRRRG